jgi:cyclopropane fatty-acyl-phospholipid synthase-like methyltransferase
LHVNYNEISKRYDNVRAADGDLITAFLEKVNFDEDARVLDFGCGTGNYAGKLQSMTNAKVYGVENIFLQLQS